MSVAKVKLQGGPVGYDKIEVDGVDITDNVSKLSLVSPSPNEISELHVTLLPKVDVELEAAVVVHDVVDEKHVLYTMKEWISRLDADDIERSALEMFGMNDNEPFSAKVLRVIQEILDEDVNLL